MKYAFRTGTNNIKLLRSVCGNSSSGVIICTNFSSVPVVANEAICKMLGYTEQELTQLNIYTLFDSMDSRKVLQAIDNLPKSNVESVILKLWLFKRGGTPVESNVKLSFINEDDGTGYFIFNIDKVPGPAEKRELHLKSFAIEESFNAMILALLDGTVTYVNKSFLELWRYQDASDVIGKSGFDCFEDPDYVRDLARSVEDSGQWEGELTAVRGDGTKANMHVSGKLLINEKHEPLGLMATCIDITSKKTSEIALRESERKLSLIFNTSQDAQVLWRVDKDDRFVCEAANQMFITKMTPLTVGQPVTFIGEEIRVILAGITLSAETIESYLVHYRRVVTTGKKVQFEGSLNLYGAWAFFELTVEPVLDQNGWCTHLLMTSRDITDRCTAEMALRESEERLRLALVASNQGIYDMNLITGEVKVTPEYISMLGYDPATFNEAHTFWQERIHSDDSDKVTRAFDDYRHGKIDEYRAEFRQQAKSGEWKWILSIGKIVSYNATGDPVRIIGTHTDITELKCVERELKESQYRLNTVLNNAPIILFSIDRAGVITLTKGKGLELLQLTGAETVGQSFFELFADVPIAVENSRKALEGASSRSTLHIRSSYFDTFYSPLHDEDGTIVGAIGMGIDITDKVKAEYVLAVKNKELQEIIDALDQSSLVSMADRRGTILKANKRFCDVSGYTQAELIGNTHKIINSGYHSKMFWKNLWQTITSGKLWRGEIKNRAKDGTEYWVNTVINPIRDENGDIVYYLSIRQDISELKKSQAIIAESEERLRHAVGVAQIGIFEHDHVSNITYWSPEQRGIFAWTSDGEVRFEDYVRHIHPDDLSSTRIALCRAYDPNNDGVFDFTHRIIDRNGNLKWLKVKSKTHFEGEGTDRQAVRTIGATEDITNHKIALELLEQSESKFRSLYELVPVGIALNDFITGRYLDFNDALYKHTGYTKEEFRKLTYWDVTPPEYETKEAEQLKSLRETGYYGPYEKEYFRKDGSRYAVLLTGVKLIDSNGREVIWSVIQDITERKEIEMKLRENEARLSEAQRMVSLGYWDYDIEADRVWWSEEQLSIVQIPQSEMPTTEAEFIRLVHPDDREQFLMNVHQLIQNGEEGSSIYRVIRPRTGEVRIIQGHAQVSRNSQGRPVKLSGVNQDITERVLADRALRESEQNLRKAQEVAKIGSWKLDLDSGSLTWSAEAHKIFDRPVGIYLSHKDFLNYVHPEDKELVSKSWNAAVKGDAHDFVHRIIVNNKIKWVREQAELTVDDYDRPLYIFGTIQDITDQKFLQDVYLTFNQSQMLTQLGSWRWTIKTNTLFWSDNTFNLYGLDKESEIGYESAMNAICPEDRNIIRAVHETSLKTKKPFEVEYRINVGTRIRWLQEKGNVLSDENGEVVEMYGVVREITDEKRDKEALEEARKASEEAASVKDEFLSVMSHEIRTPLNSVIGLSNLLLRRNPREDQLDVVKVLKSSADNLMHLVNDILDFNKIRSGKVELESLRFSLADLLHSHYASTKITTQDKRLDFDVTIDPLIPDELEGDVTRLHQIFTNLLSNAIKFTHAGYVRLTADLISIADDQCWLRFKIEDSGVGIARDKLNSVFEPFRQSELDISRKYGGTGLGLSIVKSLVDLMGGKIMLDSTLGVGTVFTIELSFGLSEIKPERVEALNPPPRYPEKGRLKKVKVLYVEDVASNRFLIENILSDNSIQCEVAASGRAALRLTSAKKFDIILMDIQMPGMDGYQTAEKIRSQTTGKNRNTAIIAFTAEPYSSSLKAKTLEYDIQYMISKPFDHDVLIRKIKLYAKPDVNKKLLFTFSFYEEAFNHDARKLRKIKKAVIADIRRFENALVKYEKTKNYENLRSEVHRIRPIIKNLGYADLRTDLDDLRLNDVPRDEVMATLKKTKKHVSKLLDRLEQLEY